MSPGPRGWPPEVPPPDAEGWERKALGWLLDLCPPDFRSYAVLRKHPIVLARFAREYVAACQEAVRSGLGNARPALRDLPVEALDEVIAAYETESARLQRAAVAVDLVGRALSGQRFAPRMDDPA